MAHGGMLLGGKGDLYELKFGESKDGSLHLPASAVKLYLD